MPRLYDEPQYQYIAPCSTMPWVYQGKSHSIIDGTVTKACLGAQTLSKVSCSVSTNSCKKAQKLSR